MTPGHYSAHCQDNLRAQAALMTERGHNIDATFVTSLATTIQNAPKFSIDVRATLARMRGCGFAGLPGLRLPYERIVIETPVWFDPAVVVTPCDKTIAVVQFEEAHPDCVYVASCNHVRLPDGEWIWAAGIACASLSATSAERHPLGVKGEVLPGVSIKVAPFLAEAWKHHSKDLPANEEERLEILYQDIVTESQAVIALLWSLEQRFATVERYPAPAGLNRKRRARGAHEFDEYHVVTLDDPREHAHSGVRHEDRMSPREHQRRGHWRHFKSGARVWVRPAVINEGIGGAVWKDYRVSK